MIEGARIVHHVPGRVRIRVPGARRNQRMLEQVREFVSGLEGVREVQINSTTGSVVVHYDPQKRDALSGYLPAPPEFGEAAEFAEKVEREAEFLAAHSQAAAAIVGSVRTVNRSVSAATDGLLDLKVLLPASLAVWAFFEMGSNVPTPLWLSLGIFSFNSFVSLHHPPPIRTMMVRDEPK